MLKRAGHRAWITPQRSATGLILLAFVQHFFFGANSTTLGLGAACLEGLMLLSLLSTTWFRTGLEEGAARWLPAAALFAGVLVLALASATGHLPAEPLPGGGLWRGSVDRQASLTETIKLGGLGCIFLIAFGIGRAEGGWKRLIDALLIAGVAFAAYALIANAMAPTRLLWLHKFTAYGRLTANFVSANTAATLFGMLLVWQATRLSQHLMQLRSPQERLSEAIRRNPDGVGLHVCGLVLFSACLLLTASRTGIAVTALSVLIALGGVSRRQTLVYWAGGVAVAFCVAGGLVLQRYGAAAAEFSERSHVVVLHARMAATRPWTGFGLGAFRDVSRALIDAETFGYLHTVGAAHNIVLQWFEQAGLLGAALMFGTVGWLLTGIAAASTQRRARSDVRAVLACSALVMLHGLLDYGLEVPSIAATWTLLLGGSAGRIARLTSLGPKARSPDETRTSRSPGTGRPPSCPR